MALSGSSVQKRALAIPLVIMISKLELNARPGGLQRRRASRHSLHQSSHPKRACMAFRSPAVHKSAGLGSARAPGTIDTGRKQAKVSSIVIRPGERDT